MNIDITQRKDTVVNIYNDKIIYFGIIFIVPNAL